MKWHKDLVLGICLLNLSGSLGFAQEPAPVRQSEPELIVPAGTTIPIILSTYLNSRSTHVGDAFYADTNYPIYIQQRLVIPRGSIIKGTVTHVQRPGKIKGRARIALRFENVLLPNGVNRDLTAELRAIHGPGAEKIERQTETVEMDSSKGRDAGEVIGSASQGAIIGAIAGGGKAAGIGAGAGSAVGLATVLFSRGRELILEPGSQFDLVLQQPLRFAYPEVEFTTHELAGTHSGPRARTRDREHDRPSYHPGRRGFPFPWYPPWP